MKKKNDEAHFAVFLKSESCDSYNMYKHGTAENVAAEIIEDFGDEIKHIGEHMVDSDNRKAGTYLCKLLEKESMFY